MIKECERNSVTLGNVRVLCNNLSKHGYSSSHALSRYITSVLLRFRQRRVQVIVVGLPIDYKWKNDKNLTGLMFLYFNN